MFAITKSVQGITQQVIEWRHQIHRNPELGLKEVKTAALVESVLRNIGLEVIRYPNSTAVVGILRGGKPGRCIALRADMDALPITELADVDYRSEVPGIMHACGHDMHTAILMGVATLLAKNREDVHGTIKFLFQPAEEGPGGAKEMVNAGALKNPEVERVFALHVYNAVPVGQIELIYGYSHANSDTADIKVIGKGGHGALPENTVDAINVACHLGVALQSIVSRNVGAIDSGVISIGSFHAGTVHNIIAETAELKLTIRSLTDETRQLLKKRIIETTEGVTKAMNASFEIDYRFGYPSVYNEESMVDIVKTVGERVLGKENVRIVGAGMGGEDFAYFAQEVPGAFFYLGAKPCDDVVYPGHSPKYKASDDAIKHGLELMLNIALEAAK